MGDRHRIHGAYLSGTSKDSSLLLSLGAVASLQEERIWEMGVGGNISCWNEEDGRALCSLLKKCDTLSVGILTLWGEFGPQLWEELGQAAARGKVQDLNTRKEVVDKAKKEDFMAVLGITIRYHLLEEEEEDFVLDEAGWNKVE